MVTQGFVRLSRKAYFAAAHRYAHKDFSEEENRRVFGACYTEHGHGHNYVLEAFFEGAIDPVTGLVVNLAEIDLLLKKVLAPLDHHHLNFDVPYFKDRVPTTENIARFCFEQLHGLIAPLGVELIKVRLSENEDLWAEVGLAPESPAPGEFNHRYLLRAIHHLHNRSLSDTENAQLYGKCFRLHGHSYYVTVALTQPLDPMTGLSVNRDHCDQVIRTNLIERFEGRNLNDFFAITSGEALAVEFYRLLEPLFPPGVLTRVEVEETRKNRFAHSRTLSARKL